VCQKYASEESTQISNRRTFRHGHGLRQVMADALHLLQEKSYHQY